MNRDREITFKDLAGMAKRSENTVHRPTFVESDAVGKRHVAQTESFDRDYRRNINRFSPNPFEHIFFGSINGVCAIAPVDYVNRLKIQKKGGLFWPLVGSYGRPGSLFPKRSATKTNSFKSHLPSPKRL